MKKFRNITENTTTLPEKIVLASMSLYLCKNTSLGAPLLRLTAQHLQKEEGIVKVLV